MLFKNILLYLCKQTIKIIIMNPTMLKYLAERKIKQMAAKGIKKFLKQDPNNWKWLIAIHVVVYSIILILMLDI